MANQYIYDLTDTWNNGATVYTSIKMNVTDSASAAGSLLMDLQVGSTSKYSIAKDGTQAAVDTSYFYDPADSTKRLRFDTGGITTATTRVWTAPDADLTFGAFAPTLLNNATAIATLDDLHTKSANVASATTTDLSTATGYFVHITGTTTITAFSTQTAGIMRILVFDGALTLTHNATSLILPGGANITTAAGDVAFMVSEGSGNWRCLSYQYASGVYARLGTANTFTQRQTLNGNWTVSNAAPEGVLDETDTNTRGRLLVDGGSLWLQAGASGSGGASSSGTLRIAGYLGADIGNFYVKRAGSYHSVRDTGNTPDGSGALATAGTDTTKRAWGADDLKVSAQTWGGGGKPDAILEDQKTSGTNGGSSSTGWNTRVLNTEVLDTDNHITLASNQFTPDANGWVEWEAPVFKADATTSCLYNVTDAAIVKLGVNINANSTYGGGAIGQGGAAVVAGKTYEIRSYIGTAAATNGFGVANSNGSGEVYTRVRYWAD